MSAASPYERALGARIADLPPSLRAYFSSLPPGHVGVGEGVFETAGVPARWLCPVLALLQPFGVLYGGWQREVPFRVVNRLARGRVVSERRFAFARGPWTMRDSVGLNAHGRLVDEVGGRVGVVASFDLDVQGGALVLTSRAVGIRIGRLRVRLPRAVAPVVRLRESIEGTAQRVRVTVDAGPLGRIYEYGGTFRYRIEEDT